jgi:site-specific recombinase XerD
MADNPLTHLEAGNIEVDRRHDRRELTADELRILLDATRASKRDFRGLSGPNRFALYATACGTGFRAAALASLTPESFDLTPTSPIVTLAARCNKSRKMRIQPLPPDVAELLREYLRGKPAKRPLWAGSWAKAFKGAEMLRRDLEAAGLAYAIDGPDGPLFADFHALRHTYLTLGGRAGIDLRTLQELAGHSTPTLTARYSHRRLHNLAGAVEKMPNFLPQNAPAVEVRATGTDGVGLSSVCTGFAYRNDTACGNMVGHDTKIKKLAEKRADANVLVLKEVAAACEDMIASESEKAPPGFEPGMADLQSVAPTPQL